MKFLNFVNNENIPDIFKPMLKILGKDMFVKIMKEYSGQTVYFPRKAFPELVDHYIKNNYKGNTRKMARDLGYKQRQVFNHIKKKNT